MSQDKHLIDTTEAEQIYTGPGIYTVTMTDGSEKSLGYCACLSILEEKIDEVKKAYGVD